MASELKITTAPITKPVKKTKKKQKKRSINTTSNPAENKLNQIYYSQGLVGKLFDKIQGVLGVGLSRKKLKSQIDKQNSNDIDKQLNKYYDQQKNTTELTLDVITGLIASLGIRVAKKINTLSHLYIKNPKFEATSLLIGLGATGLIGLFTKPILKAINNIGTSKEDRKRERTTGKDFLTGMIDGVAASAVYAHKLGIIVGAGINSVSRYVFNKKTDDKRDQLRNHLTSGIVPKAIALGVAGVSAFKFHKRVDVLENAIKKSKENVQNIQIFDAKIPLSELLDLAEINIRDPQVQQDLVECTRKGFFSDFYLKIRSFFTKKGATAEEVGMKDAVEIGRKPLRRAMRGKDLFNEEEMMNIMREIERYNIFYPKMIQTMPSNIVVIKELLGGTDALAEIFGKSLKIEQETNWLSKRIKNYLFKNKNKLVDSSLKTVNDFLNSYKSCCPASRTIIEAQTKVNAAYGNRFTILGEKPIGVGTIAESYLAKDNHSGKEVVIKMVKEWISEEKLLSDKQKMLNTLERVKDQLKPDEYNYQKKLIDELYSAWTKEVNLSLEADAARTLGKYAENYNTVAPIDVVDNIFVMEKANGVQFDKFAEYLEKNNIQLTKDQAIDLFRKYMTVFFEQLLSVPKHGDKVMHADPHAGNIFINLANKELPFTFIDTGNVIRYSAEEAIQNVTSHVDYMIGNSKAIAKRLLKGAVLPENINEQEAIRMLANHLDETFFSGKYKIRTSDPFSAINNESMEFMKKHKIILNSSNTNMIKAELTYLMNLVSITKIAKNINLNSAINEAQQIEQTKLMVKQILKSIWNSVINNKKVTYREVASRIKFMQDNPEQVFTSLYTYLPPDIAKREIKAPKLNELRNNFT